MEQIPTQIDPEQIRICPKCHTNNSARFYFCINCGTQLLHKPLSTSFWKQIGIYTFCFLMPPLGLWPGYQYLHERSNKGKMIGVMAILITAITTAISTYYFFSLYHLLASVVGTQASLELPGS